MRAASPIIALTAAVLAAPSPPDGWLGILAGHGERLLDPDRDAR